MLAAASMSAKGTVRIAASANLVFALDEICAAFQAERPEVKVESVIGSSGNLVAQIAHGAPYDIFLSADMEYPLALIKNGQADAASLTPFATGRLVLWTTRSDLPMTELESVLHDTRMRKLAIANPDTAPYGRAARQTLEKLERWDAMQSNLVIGESISRPNSSPRATLMRDLSPCHWCCQPSSKIPGNGWWFLKISTSPSLKAPC
jgi:molybdate transport system substrate-binding protein